MLIAACWLVGPTQPGTNRIIGAMQLYSKEKNVSQPIEGHAAAFHSYTCEGASSPSTLFTFAAKTAAGSKVLIVLRLYLSPTRVYHHE